MLKASFQHFQTTINSVSATPPDFNEVCLRWGVTPVVVEGAPCVPFGKINLLPHQVSGIDFLVRMLHTNLRSALLSDDTGLGKTIQALATIAKINDGIKEGLQQHDCKFSLISYDRGR